MRGHAFRSGGLSSPAIVCRLFRAGGWLSSLGMLWGIFCSSLKNGVFLTVPEGQNSANAAELLAKRRRGAGLSFVC